MPDPNNNRFCRYLPVIVNNTACSALLDSGNTYRSAISLDFFKKLGFSEADLEPLPQTSVATALTGHDLTVLGMPRTKLHLRLADHDTVINFQPAVIKDLSMPINISGPFLKQHHIDQLHSQNAIRFQGKVLPLTPVSANSFVAPEHAKSRVYVVKDTPVPAMSTIHTHVRVAAIADSFMPPGDGFLEGGGGDISFQKGLPWISAIVTAQPDGFVVAGLSNPTEKDIVVKAGSRYGQFTRLCAPEDHSAMPWRIAVIGEPARENHKNSPTLQQKLATAIRQAAANLILDKDKVKIPKTETEKRRWITEQFQVHKAPGSGYRQTEDQAC